MHHGWVFVADASDDAGRLGTVFGFVRAVTASPRDVYVAVHGGPLLGLDGGYLYSAAHTTDLEWVAEGLVWSHEWTGQLLLLPRAE